MKKAFYLLFSILFLNSVSSCTDDTIGSSFTGNNLSIIADSSFIVKGQSVRNEQILTRTMTQLLGAIKADNFGELKSDFVCQFLPTIAIDTTGVTANMIESIRLIMRSPLGGYTGDSIMPMRANVYQLNKQLTTPINSSFNPKGYYTENEPIGASSYTATYSGSTTMIHSTVEKGSYRNIITTLPKSLAVKMFNEYINNPETFKSSAKFNEFFPGIYVENTYGSGRVTNIDKTFILVNYRRRTKTEEGNDTIVRDSSSYASAAPEVITNNNISMKIDPKILNRVNEGEAILQAPLGYEVKINFPIEELVHKYNSDPDRLKVLNSLSFSIPVENIKNDYKIAPPPYILLIKSSEKEEFFKKNKITDNVTSFYATYNYKTKSYDFNSLRPYIIELLDASAEELQDAADMTIVPVDVVTESSYDANYNTTTTVTSMTPAVSGPMLCKLNLDNAKIKFVYSKKIN